MKEALLNIIRKRLPRNFRLRWHSMSIEYPLSVVPLSLYPPTLEKVQVATRRGIFGLFRRWKSIGEIHIDEDVIYLWTQYFNKYRDIFVKVIEPINEHVSVQMGTSKASQRYRESLRHNRDALNYHGLLNDDKEEEPESKQNSVLSPDRPPY